MPQIKNVVGTAFVVAEFRAEENWQAAPLYHDPVVGLFLSEDSRDAAARVAASFPVANDLVRVRTKYLDDMLERQINSNVRQVVILGAGLDTRAVRKAAAGVRYFEIDDRETLSFKQACYEENEIEADATFIPGNYVTDGLIELLKQNDFEFDAPTYVIWEGNTMYLPMPNITGILTELRAHVPRLRLSFDYMSEAVVTMTTGDPAITRLVESFASMGAPWVSGIRDIRTLARETQLTLVENHRTSELYQEYWPARPVTSPIFGLYSLCTLASERGAHPFR
jgi:methyltransferase (TIGR00027 family)